MKLWIKTLLMLGSIILVTAIAAGGYTLTVLNSTTKAFKMSLTVKNNELSRYPTIQQRSYGIFKRQGCFF